MSVTAAGFVELSNPLMQGMKRLGFLIAVGLRSIQASRYRTTLRAQNSALKLFFLLPYSRTES